MRLMGLQTQSQYNLGQTAVEQSAKLRDLLGKSVNTEGLQGWNAGPMRRRWAWISGRTKARPTGRPSRTP